MPGDDKKVDEGWKESVRKEKGESGPAEEAPLEDKVERPEAKFTLLISSLATQALVSLGEIENPLSKKKETDLDGAKFSIDMLQMLSEKTRGNLDDLEKRYLDGVLYDLRMRFVEASK